MKLFAKDEKLQIFNTKVLCFNIFLGFVSLTHNDIQGLLNTFRTFPVMIIGIFDSGDP